MLLPNDVDSYEPLEGDDEILNAIAQKKLKRGKPVQKNLLRA